MIITVNRDDRTESRTISTLTIPDFSCYVLEDTDRGLTDEMPLDRIKQLKVYGQTAIPYGKYEVVISYSNRFKKMLPLLIGVKGFEGIRIHPGNYASNTEGCLLPGLTKSANAVLSSRVAMGRLQTNIMKWLKKEKVWVEIVKPEAMMAFEMA